MYTLKNTQISVEILDPITNASRLGSRYCTGGYIWQVVDARQGDLLSGPLYPEEPNTFDGQGMPDMFHQPLGAEDVPVGGEVHCIGVGQVRRTSPVEPFEVRHNPEVIEFLRWNVEEADDTIIMTTAGTFREWAYDLERSVVLDGRTVHSTTIVRNQGTALPIRWFAHPFFPLTEDNVLCRFSMPVSMPENPGYYLNPQAYVVRKADHDWNRGWYQPVDYERSGSAISVVQKHPKIGEVLTETDFMPSFLPIWGNARTFSFEPYTERVLQTGESTTWKISYTF
jgi:hypothetical protein